MTHRHQTFKDHQSRCHFHGISVDPEKIVEDLLKMVIQINRFRQTTAWRNVEAEMPRHTQLLTERILRTTEHFVASIVRLFQPGTDPVSVLCSNKFYFLDLAVRAVAAHAVLDRFLNRLAFHDSAPEPVADPNEFYDLMGDIIGAYDAGCKRRESSFGSTVHPADGDFGELFALIEREAMSRLRLGRPNPILRDRVVAHFEIFKTIVEDEKSHSSNGCWNTKSGGGLGRRTKPLALS